MPCTKIRGSRLRGGPKGIDHLGNHPTQSQGHLCPCPDYTRYAQRAFAGRARQHAGLSRSIVSSLRSSGRMLLMATVVARSKPLDVLFPSEMRGCSRLLVVLCNPPLGRAENTTSWRNVEALSSVIGIGQFKITNLIDHPTRSTRDLVDLVGTIDLDALRLRLSSAARHADVTVAGWGVRAPAGWQKSQWSAVVGAAAQGLSEGGHRQVWHVGGGPRHPSRWRQHTSPIHQRYLGSTFEARLASALIRSDVESLLS